MKNITKILSAALPVLVAGSASAVVKEKPNVIFLLSDDVGFGDLECYNGKAATPCVNNLASKGCLFTNGHAVASTSTPSRYSILTGEYAWREKGTGVAPGNAGMIIKPDRYTVADMFKSAGYTTGAFGKWHLGLGSITGGQDWNGELDQDLTDIGFDEFQIMAATADRVPCVYIQGNSAYRGKAAKHGRIVNLDPKDPISVSYTQSLGDSTWTNYPTACKLAPSDGGHVNTIVDGIPRIGHSKGGRSALWKDADIADSIAASTIRFIKDCHANNEPFFAYMCTNDVHVPRWPHARFQGKSGMGLRGDAILSLDWTIGQITHTLDSLGIADNTIIVITSDNGPVLDDGYADNATNLANAKGHLISGGLRGGKYSSFEGGTRVPFLVQWPGHVPAGTVSDALVSQVDLMATMADVVGGKMPLGTAPDSKVQTAAWLGQDLKQGRNYVLEMTNDGSTIAVRTSKWKYIPSSPEQLYDMSACNTYNQYTTIKTAIETNNVAAANPMVLDSMRSILKNEISKAEESEVYKLASEYIEGATPKPTIISKLDTLGTITSATGLPGTIINSQYEFTSGKFTTKAPVTSIRLTIKATTTHTSGQVNASKAYCPVSIADFTLYDNAGSPVVLSASNFSTNNQEPTEGSIANICDGLTTNYWHSTWSVPTPEQPYIEIALPQAMTSFSFKYTSRKTANAPLTILVSAVTSTADTVAALKIPKGYQDTLRAEYAWVQAHCQDEGFKTTLPQIVKTIKSYLTWNGFVEAGSLMVDDTKAATILGVLTNEQFNFIKSSLAAAGDIATDSAAYNKFVSFFTPQEGACYKLYNRKVAKYAGMTDGANSCHGTDASSDNYNWAFVPDKATGAYLLYNEGIKMPISRTSSASSIYGEEPLKADTWTLRFVGSGYFNVIIDNSDIITTRSYLNDNGSTINAWTTGEDPSACWTIEKTGKVHTSIKEVNAQNYFVFSGDAYDLFGRKAPKYQKGVVYIQGGKKFLSK